MYLLGREGEIIYYYAQLAKHFAFSPHPIFNCDSLSKWGEEWVMELVSISVLFLLPQWDVCQ